MWVVCIVLSIVFTVLNWVLALRDNKKAHWAAFCAVSFAALYVFLEYRMVLMWVEHEDWSALMSVVPGTSGFLAKYVPILILANALALIYKKRSNS